MKLYVCPLRGIIINDAAKHGESIKLEAISHFENNLDLLKDYFRPCFTAR